MKLFHMGKGFEGHVVLLFGSGLIGTSIARCLLKEGAGLEEWPFSWNDSSAHFGQLDAIRSAIPSSATRVSVAWAAGRSGFQSADAEMTLEFDALQSVLSLASSGTRTFPQAQHSVHLVSSAGGLFEGMKACGPDTVPMPLRPYGHGKLAQEAAIAALDPCIGKRVYRPSSVYGYVKGGRVGLIPALMSDAIRGRTSRVFGGLSTLRDYVLADDVGNYIAKDILSSDSQGTETRLLVLARPATIFEVVRLVERAIGKGLRIQVDPRPSNARDISFLPAACPSDWQPTALWPGVAQTAQAVRHSLWAARE